jgi:hypothetical protein
MTTGQGPQTANAPDGLRVIEVTERWAMGEFERCVAIVWCGQPDVHALTRRGEELVELTKKFPGNCALVEVVESTAKPPSQEARRVAMEVFRKLGSDLSAIGFVLEGNEMRSAMIRAVITGMLFFLKQPQPSKVFKQLGPMIEWLKPRISATEDFGPRLTAVLDHLRQLMHARTVAS